MTDPTSTLASTATSTATATSALGNNEEDVVNAIRPFGYSSMECGYCKGKRASVVSPPKSPSDCSKSFGMLVDAMTPRVYEKFLYRGWRRSGIHLYKPSNFESCCPTLTIRLAIGQFQPTKSQAKLRRKLENLLQPPSSINPRRRKPQPPDQHAHDLRSSTDQQEQQQQQKKQKQQKEIQQQQQQKEKHQRGNRRNGQSLAPLESFVRQSGILSTLEIASRHALLETVRSSLDASAVATISAALSTATVIYKSRPPSRHDEKQRRVTVASSICAQLAGTYKLDKGPLLQGTVNALKVSASLQTRIHSKTTNGVKGTDDDNISIHSIDFHAKSGQILVVLQIPGRPLSKQGSSPRTDEPDISMQDADDDDDATTAENDKLGQWYQSTMGKPLLPHQRQLRIHTLPSHQSALNPEVHQLYAYYQHVVHQDPNPLEESTSTDDDAATTDSIVDDDHTNSNSSTLAGLPADTSMSPQGKEKNVMSDSSSLSSNNQENDKQESAAELTARSSCATDQSATAANRIKPEYDPLAAIENLDWGPHPPKSFTDQVSQMLRDYLTPYQQSPAVQKALLDNFYSFYQFLVESPFAKEATATNKSVDDDLPSLPYGTYHQQYRIGDVLIAVGVVDVLPRGLSSVYLYYHPGFSHSLVALGKLAILKEIDFCLQLQKPYYYLGYYIESCPKMRYKAEYQPSQLLCPVSYQWVDCPVAVPKLQAVPQNVCSLVEEPAGTQEVFMSTPSSEIEEDSSGGSHKHRRTINTSPPNDMLSQISMDIGAGMTISLDMLQESGKEIVRPILEELVREAGLELSRTCLVKLT